MVGCVCCVILAQPRPIPPSIVKQRRTPCILNDGVAHVNPQVIHIPLGVQPHMATPPRVAPAFATVCRHGVAVIRPYTARSGIPRRQANSLRGNSLAHFGMGGYGLEPEAATIERGAIGGYSVIVNLGPFRPRPIGSHATPVHVGSRRPVDGSGRCWVRSMVLAPQQVGAHGSRSRRSADPRNAAAPRGQIPPETVLKYFHDASASCVVVVDRYRRIDPMWITH